MNPYFIHYENLITILEIIAFLCGIIYVILAAKENILCWLYGGISVIIYSYIFYISNLLAESFLQIFYLAISLNGFLSWSKKNKKEIKSMKPIQHLKIITGGVIMTIIISFIIINLSKSSYPIIDSFTTSFGIIATFLTAKKILENWIYWITINVFSIYIYVQKGLLITSSLYLIYVILAIYGYIQWKKQLQK
ncbi:MAG: nicotinamide mononucleotide transporter [Flavobacteriales bacterium]|nr:nicotinamide mononucleotide transporter [Flavobacteriales bacterium]|tara:strand:+ start:2224 stop:2802 length:579 start_codon:yes stop_codon:yes gene_type:complete